MEGTLLPEAIQIKSKIGNYSINWNTPQDEQYQSIFNQCRIAIVDKNVNRLYGDDPETFGRISHLIIQDAEEEKKTAETSLSICSKLLDYDFKRGETLVAIGGGIIQDLVTFSASILFRGIPWIFIPTTLLAQADSCIGGKSSINFYKWKNQLGNFYPPRRINIVPDFLETLTDQDIRSGLGEILKVHLLAGPSMVKEIITYLIQHPRDNEKFHQAIFRSLKVKSDIIEEDEFDTGKRLLLNFGHTFGHALETATNFGINHGIGVALGVDMAGFLSFQMGKISEDYFKTIHSLVATLIRPEDKIDVDQESFIQALKHDKKTRPGQYCFILPYELGKVEKVFLPMDEKVEATLAQYFSNLLPDLWQSKW